VECITLQIVVNFIFENYFMGIIMHIDYILFSYIFYSSTNIEVFGHSQQ
jgi:hypothetical protein